MTGTIANKSVFVVLLYPPHGRPRVESFKCSPFYARMSGLRVFKTREAAETALEGFFKQNPEYRNWCDGKLTA